MEKQIDMEKGQEVREGDKGMRKGGVRKGERQKALNK